MLSKPIGITVREYSMKVRLELEIIQWMQPLLMLRFRGAEINLAAWDIFRIFV
jgi:hypothetical protein